MNRTLKKLLGIACIILLAGSFAYMVYFEKSPWTWAIYAVGYAGLCVLEFYELRKCRDKIKILLNIIAMLTLAAAPFLFYFDVSNTVRAGFILVMSVCSLILQIYNN